MSVSSYDKDNVQRTIDALLISQDTLTRREIDASCCRTKHDWARLHEQQDKHQSAYDIAIQEILQMIAHARRGR